MLNHLFGSKNAEKILLFLLVNEFGYGSEIQKACGTALTPLQSMLKKLEQGGVLLHEMQQKTKLYRFNPSYPLLEELKALLRKAFTNLPPEEKRVLFSRKSTWNSSSKNEASYEKRIGLCLDTFWERLKRIKRVSIQTQSGGFAFGDVHIQEENKSTLIFTEHGSWKHPTPQEISFNNMLRWSLDVSAKCISLEHLRYGLHSPVFLVSLTPTGPNTLQSIDAHLCSTDCYFGRIEFTKTYIRFLWRILGAKKNEVLHHTYSW